MTDDTASGRHGGRPAHRSPGRLDPAPDLLPDPGQRPVPAPAEPTTAPGPTRSSMATPAIRRSRTGGLWVGLVLSALVLLLLLVFILQNGRPVQISFFALEGALPLGVALLLAAIAGILLVAIPGSLRILQLRRAARHGSSGKE
jgi:uncharacterized integral membrane protein